MRSCFLKLFRDAARTRQPNDTFESLKIELQTAQRNQDLVQENLVAKKICIINALEGLYLYIPSKLRLIAETQTCDPSDIGQDIIHTLSLIYFIEQTFSAADQAWLLQQKTSCQKMLVKMPNAMQEFMDNEAHQAAESLISSYSS